MQKNWLSVNFPWLLYDITSGIHILSVTYQSCVLLVHDFINTCNMIETTFDYLHMGCVLVFLMELLHF